jgi:hypothetical protein
MFAERGTISGGEAAELVKAEAARDFRDGGCRAVLRRKRTLDFAQPQTGRRKGAAAALRRIADVLKVPLDLLVSA